jgi:hypothetical protein
MVLIMGTVLRCLAQTTEDSAVSTGQAGAVSGDTAFGSAATGGQEISPTGEYKQGLAPGGWIFAPEIFLGGVYNTNADQLAAGANNGASLRVAPRITGYHDGGMSKTSVYGVMDGQFFNSNTIAATAGLTNSYSPQDWLFGSYFNYTRETSIFNSALNFNNDAISPPGAPPSGIPLMLNPFGTTPG